MDSVLSILTTAAIIFGVVMLFNFMIFVHELGHFFCRALARPLCGQVPDLVRPSHLEEDHQRRSVGAGMDSGGGLRVPAADGSHGGH